MGWFERQHEMQPDGVYETRGYSVCGRNRTRSHRESRWQDCARAADLSV